MRRINRTNRPVLITPDEVIFHIASDKQTDARLILNSIINAEERIIAPALGDDFYYSLIEKKNLRVTSSNQSQLLADINADRALEGLNPLPSNELKVGMYINAIEFITDPKLVLLWEMFLWKLTAESVDLLTTVPSWLRHTGAGQQKNNPEVIGGSAGGSVTGDYKDIKFKLDIQLQDRIDPLAARMHAWICKRKSDYPLYKRHCECNDDGIAIGRKTDWVFPSKHTAKSTGNCTDCMNQILTEIVQDGFITELGECIEPE
jgi:hypothetical protein